MDTDTAIQRATSGDAREVAVMVGELLAEIMNAINVQAFDFDLEETTARLKDFLDREKYFVFVARNDSEDAIGFVALYESHALYAEGAFGTIPELYVRPHPGAGSAWKSQRHRFHSLIKRWRFMNAKVSPFRAVAS
jgi:hypothetical protein